MRITPRISAARVIVTCPGRNFVTLKITPDEGLTGVGDATVNGREMAVVAYLTEHVVPVLIGRDATRIEDTWQYLYQGAYWRRGPITMAAIAAVDMALWDIKGKQAGLPVHQLLGGRSREGVTVYGHATAPTSTRCWARSTGTCARASGRCGSSRHPGLEKVLRGQRQGDLRAGELGGPGRVGVVDRGLPQPRPDGLRPRPRGVRPPARSCSTTCTTGSPRSRPPGWASRWSPTR
jgi:hypothetical protein